MKKQVNIIALIFTVAVVSMFSCAKNNQQDLLEDAGGCDTTSTVSYTNDVRPILDQNCSTANCHSTITKASNYDLEAYNTTKVAVLGNRFFGTINHTSGFSSMPKGSSKLSDCDISKLTRWANDGAPNN